MVRFWHIGWVSFLLLSLGFLGTPERSVAAFQAPQSAQDLLDEMTVEERVGQLFLVAFEGDSVAPSSDIVDLILNYKVGGVVLLPKNDNLSDGKKKGRIALTYQRRPAFQVHEK